MEKAALSSAAPEMMPLVTSLVESVARKSATQAGKASTALSVSVYLLVSLGAGYSSVLRALVGYFSDIRPHGRGEPSYSDWRSDAVYRLWWCRRQEAFSIAKGS